MYAVDEVLGFAWSSLSSTTTTEEPSASKELTEQVLEIFSACG